MGSLISPIRHSWTPRNKTCLLMHLCLCAGAVPYIQSSENRFLLSDFQTESIFAESDYFGRLSHR